MCYDALGAFYYYKEEDSFAKKFFELAIGLLKELVNKSLDTYGAELARMYGTLGALYIRQNNNLQAQKYYKLAIDIYEELVKKNQKQYSYMLMMNKYVYESL